MVITSVVLEFYDEQTCDLSSLVIIALILARILREHKSF